MGIIIFINLLFVGLFQPHDLGPELASNLPNKFIFFMNKEFFSLYLVASPTYTSQYKI